MQPTNSNPTYTFAEFLTHLDDTHSFVLGGERNNIHSEDSFFRSLALTCDYMQKRYDDPDVAAYKSAKFIHIMHYISEHIEDFDFDYFAIKGSDTVGSLISEHLLHAVFQIFSDKNFWPSETDLDPAKVKTLAVEIREGS